MQFVNIERAEERRGTSYAFPGPGAVRIVGPVMITETQAILEGVV